MGYKEVELIEVESRMVVTRGWGGVEMCDRDGKREMLVKMGEISDQF
jgi:hypothetical protein